MSAVKIDVQSRGTEEKNNELRRGGIIPAVLYGYKVANKNLKVLRNEFEKVYAQAGESGLIELNIDSKEKKYVVVKEAQKDHVKNIFLHVDFYQVDMKKEIEVELPLNYVGESEVVKNKGGILTTNLDSIRVKCLPGDLLEMVDVDLSNLKSFSDKIKVSDLTVPASVTITSQANALIANVLEPKIVNEEETNVVEESKEDGVEKSAAGEEKSEEGGEEANK